MKKLWLSKKFKFCFLLFPLWVSARPLQVLVNSSFKGKGSMGEWIEREFKASCADCSVELVSDKDASGLGGRLRVESQRGGESSFDLVLGLDAHHYAALAKEGLVENGKVFDRSPFAIIVDSKKMPQASWPKNWKELAALKPFLLVEDPRLSEAGVGWLRSIFEFKLIDLPRSKKVTARVFPSWSSAYAAFLKGEGSAVWSYLASEAYHRCEIAKKGGELRYFALPLAEGYPVQEEWLAFVTKKSAHPRRAAFKDFVLGQKAQEQIPLLNWMFPARAGIKLPDCYAYLRAPEIRAPAQVLDAQKLKAWADEWSY